MAYKALSTAKAVLGAVFLAASVTGLYGQSAALPDACDAQPDLRGLSETLVASAGRFGGLDRLMVEDAGGALAEYRELVAALCARIEAWRISGLASLEGRRLALAALSGCSDDRDACWKESEARIRKPIVPRGTRLFSCVAGGYVGADYGLGVGCGLTIWP